MNQLQELMNQGKTNRATFEFILGCYYYYMGNPVWYIFRANAIRSVLPTSKTIKYFLK